MRKLVAAFQNFFTLPARPSLRRNKCLSRQEVLMLMANNKLSSTQAKAVIAKRFNG